jgi:ATP-binding cassette subfamily B protein/subfamily B ATP-binding cassette protein MsbA
LNFGYDINKPLFLNFSATIPANKITGIVGKSWRKTTLIDIIAGLQKVGDATLQVDVFDEENFPIWRSQLGICPRFFLLMVLFVKI